MFAYTFSPIASSGFGISNSSLDQTGEISPSRSLGQAGLKVYNNVATGNLVIVDHMATAREMNGTHRFGYVYNSQAAKPWHFTLKSLANIPSPPNSGTITLIEEDGHETVYTYNNGKYIAPEYVKGRPQLWYDNSSGVWRWYDPATGNSAVYNNRGLLSDFVDAAGRKSHYTYDQQDQLTSVTGPSAARYEISRSDSEVYIYLNENGVKTVLQHHAFDTKGRLTTTTIGNNDYKITYSYIDGTNLLSNVTQSDGTCFKFDYDSHKTDGRANLISSGNHGNIEHIDYSRFPEIIITDPVDGQKVTVILDAQKRVSQVKKENGDTAPVDLPDITAYQYTELGQLDLVTNPNRGQESFQYDALGFITHRTGSSDQETFNQYDAQTGFLLLTFQVYKKEDPNPIQCFKTYYIYDNDFDKQGKQHTVLKFVISPSSKVTEYTYDPIGNKASERVYFTPYDTSYLTHDQLPTLAELTKWREAQIYNKAP